eukprot:34770_1
MSRFVWFFRAIRTIQRSAFNSVKHHPQQCNKTHGIFLSTIAGFGALSMTKPKINSAIAQDDVGSTITNSVLERIFDKWVGFKGPRYTTEYRYLRWKRDNSIGFSMTDPNKSVFDEEYHVNWKFEHNVVLLEIVTTRYFKEGDDFVLQSIANPVLISAIETAYNQHRYMSNELLVQTAREYGYIVAMAREQPLRGSNKKHKRLQILLVKYDETAQQIL